jgi:ribonuclease HIII
VTTTFGKWRLDQPAARARVEAALRGLDGPLPTERSEANCSLRLDFARGGERAIVRQFTNGTLTLQNANPNGAAPSALFDQLRACIEAAAGPAAPAAGATPVRAASDGPDPATVFTTAWIGTDEAGKGDYFGPLVSAAVFVDTRTSAILQELGVRDSKTLTDGRVRQLARTIQQTVGQPGAAVVRIRPERYNRLYDELRREGKSLNTLLAWAHARAIEDLLAAGVETDNVLVDRFTDVAYIRARLLRQSRARTLNLVALPRAEANVAVAAASILARASFVDWIERTSRELGLTLPKGASEAVVRVARQIVAQHGQDRLAALAKLHFKTTEQVLGR